MDLVADQPSFSISTSRSAVTPVATSTRNATTNTADATSSTHSRPGDADLPFLELPDVFALHPEPPGDGTAHHVHRARRRRRAVPTHESRAARTRRGCPDSAIRGRPPAPRSPRARTTPDLRRTCDRLAIARYRVIARRSAPINSGTARTTKLGRSTRGTRRGRQVAQFRRERGQHLGAKQPDQPAAQRPGRTNADQREQRLPPARRQRLD